MANFKHASVNALNVMSLAFITQKYMSCSSNKSCGYEQNKSIGTWAWARPYLLHAKTIYYIHHASKDKEPTLSKTKDISIDGTNKTRLHFSSMVFKTRQRYTKRIKKGKRPHGMPPAWDAYCLSLFFFCLLKKKNNFFPLFLCLPEMSSTKILKTLSLLAFSFLFFF